MDTENKKIMRRIIIIFICSILAPIAMDYFILGNSFPSNIDNDTWAGFLGSYIGGIATIVVFYLTILHTNEQNHRIEQRQRLEDKENRRLLIMPYIETRYDIVKNLQRERDNLRVFKMLGAKVEHVKTTLSDVDKKFMGLKNIESNYYLEYKLINAGAGNAVNMNIFVNGFKTDFTLLKNESGYLFLMINPRLFTILS